MQSFNCRRVIQRMGHGLGTDHEPKRKALKPMGFRAKCWSIAWFELAFLPGDFAPGVL
jgi:hypothetical protein